MARLSSLLKAARGLKERWSDETTRFVDFVVQFREVDRKNTDGSGKIEPTGRHSKVYGWRFDRWKVAPDGTLGDYVDDDEIPASAVHVIDCNPSQFRVVTNDKARRFLIYGSRGASKTELLVRFLLKLAAKKPRGRSATVLPKRKKGREFVEEKLLPITPSQWLDRAIKAQDELALYCSNRHHFDFLTAKVKEDARASTLVGGAIDETQLASAEVRNNLLLSCRGAGDFQIVETATLLDGEFMDHLEAMKADEDCEVVELSVTDNVHLDVEFDPITGHYIPAVVVASRKSSPKAMFEQEVGVWDPAAKRYRPKVWRPEGRVYYGFDSAKHVHPWAKLDAEKAIRKAFADARPGVGGDITMRRFRAPWLVGYSFEANPHAALVAKVYHTPPGHPDLVWFVDEVYNADNDVKALGRELQRRGYGRALIVPDAFGRASEGGQSSVDLLQLLRFRIGGAAQNAYERDRHNAMNAKMLNAIDQVSMWVDGAKCPRFVNALRSQALGDNGHELAMDGGDDHFAMAAGHLVAHLWPAAGAAAQPSMGYAI